MHPILTRPERLALYLGAWVVVGILIAGVLNRQGLMFAEALVLVLPLFLAYSFVCLSAWYVCRAVPLRSSGVWRVLIACVLSSAIASGIWLALAYAWIAVFDSMPDLAGMAARDRQQIPLLFAAAVLMFLLALAVTYLGLAFEEAREAERRQFELEAHARNAELRALRAQLDPHFLYNCLNSIAALTSADSGGARRMCLLLAEFLRSTLHVGPLARIPLGDELALADRFLAIEQVRFGDRLQVRRQIDQSSLAARVPPLFLQPLVENAVRHGIAERPEGGRIAVAARVDSSHLQLSVSDDGRGDSHRRGSGFGLESVRRRLGALYGDGAAVLADRTDTGFAVTVAIPARRPEHGASR